MNRLGSFLKGEGEDKFSLLDRNGVPVDPEQHIAGVHQSPLKGDSPLR
ncbi:MAG: hypothetical protein BWY86_00400 [Candidatus Aminicenantes bacterium ADurb.Bin508]|nr:MAG: hypothetical protein BWY86_00400 [Candidatus Aminicenantes bacterium ADurb.Bin508]